MGVIIILLIEGFPEPAHSLVLLVIPTPSHTCRSPPLKCQVGHQAISVEKKVIPVHGCELDCRSQHITDVIVIKVFYWLPILVNKNPGNPVTFEFQIKNERFVIVISMSHTIFGTVKEAKIYPYPLRVFWLDLRIKLP